MFLLLKSLMGGGVAPHPKIMSSFTLVCHFSMIKSRKTGKEPLKIKSLVVFSGEGGGLFI